MKRVTNQAALTAELLTILEAGGQDQGVRRAGLLGFSPWLIIVCLLTVPSRGLPSVYVCFQMSSYKAPVIFY